MSAPIVLGVRVPEPSRDYSIRIQPGLFAFLGQELRRALPKAGRIAIVSDDQVAGLYGEQALAGTRAEGFQAQLHRVPVGEASKCIAQLERLLYAFADQQLGRGDAVLALGGGVIGDLAGTAAATFMRGIRWVQCPTSLLAQVDASVGGKVAVDLGAAKNLVGAFHFPNAVLIDPTLLESLDRRHLRAGAAEMLKHGALFDPSHFHAVSDARLEDPEAMAPLIARSVALKADCVSVDPREGRGGGRELLNLGHTLGHAVESASDFQLVHGEAVGLGLLAAARISAARGVADPALEATFRAALTQLSLPTDLDTWLGRQASRDRLAELMTKDKKRHGAKIDYIGLKALGRPARFSLEAEEIVALLRSKN